MLRADGLRGTMLLMCVLAASARASAQQTVARTLVGGYVAASAGAVTSAVPVFAGSAECGELTSGWSFDGLAGGVASLDRVLGPIGFGGGLSLGVRSTSLAAPPPVPSRIFDERGESIVELEREYRRTTRGIVAALDLRAHASLGGGLWLALGPSVSTSFAGSVEQLDVVSGPGRFRFADGQSTHTMDASHASSPASVSTSLGVELGRRTRLGGLLLDPYAGIRFDLTSRLAGVRERAVAATLGCRVLFDITPPVDPPPLAHSPVEVATPARIPPLTASLAIYGVDASGTRQAAPVITVREAVERRHLPLVPAIFFDPSSSAIATRYVDAGDAPIDELVTAQRHLLDTIAARMTARPAARLRLWGVAAGDEPATLAEERAGSIRSYLVETRGIAPDRVEVVAGAGPLERSSEAGADGRDDNRRVELASDDPALLAPIVVVRTTRLFDPPAIELEPTIDAPAGVADWTITLMQDDAPIARFARGDSAAARPVWNLAAERIDSTLGELVARLDVVDSSGATVTASAATTLRTRVHTDERASTASLARHHLVAFEFDRAEPGAVNEREVAAIVRSIRPGASVRIVGTADRIGDVRHNLELARRRADAIAALFRRALGAVSIGDVAIERGEVELAPDRFTNDLPEGRFLSRGVMVTVEQGSGR